jgi:hypothetical protein
MRCGPSSPHSPPRRAEAVHSILVFVIFCAHGFIFRACFQRVDVERGLPPGNVAAHVDAAARVDAGAGAGEGPAAHTEGGAEDGGARPVVSGALSFVGLPNPTKAAPETGRWRARPGDDAKHDEERQEAEQEGEQAAEQQGEREGEHEGEREGESAAAERDALIAANLRLRAQVSTTLSECNSNEAE